MAFFNTLIKEFTTESGIMAALIIVKPLMDINDTMVDCWRDGCWSVWIFLKMENPLSESALEARMDKRPAIKLVKLGNHGCPSKVFILYQNAPGLGFSSVAELYVETGGWSAGESLKSMNSSPRRSSVLESARPNCGNHFARPSTVEKE